MPRVIPCLLLRGQGLVKGVQFDNYKYVGDPINAVRIFSEKEVDELIFLDIAATKEDRVSDPALIQMIADESFVPFCVGGGIRKLSQIRDLLNAGAEKVAINTAAVETPDFVREAAATFGSQSIIISIDVKRSWLGAYTVYTRSGNCNTGLNPVALARQAEQLGAGEILLTSINRDGTRLGYDIPLIRSVATAVSIPVIACGGARSLPDIHDAVVKGSASAAAAGSLFVFHGPKRAVLINFPGRSDLDALWTGHPAGECGNHHNGAL